MSKRIDILEQRTDLNNQLFVDIRRFGERLATIEQSYSTLTNVAVRDSVLERRIVQLETDISQLIRHEAEELFKPNEIWWEKKIFLAAAPALASQAFDAFGKYLKYKFKATKADLAEWSLLTARCAL